LPDVPDSFQGYAARSDWLFSLRMVAAPKAGNASVKGRLLTPPYGNAKVQSASRAIF